MLPLTILLILLQLIPPTAIPVREETERGRTGAVYGTYSVPRDETLVVTIDPPVPAGRGRMWATWSGDLCYVNGSGGVWVPSALDLAGTQVTIQNRGSRECTVEIRGEVWRCTGPGCEDLSGHWASDPFRKTTWRPGALGRIIYNFIASGLGWLILILVLAGSVGSQLVQMMFRIVGGLEDDEDDDDDLAEHHLD